MSREARIPGGGFMNETGTREARVPGCCFVNETISTIPPPTIRRNWFLLQMRNQLAYPSNN
jgi:hypothetical protein